MKISNEQFNQLISIFYKLSDIYTKGDDSILLVQCRQILQKILTDIHASEPIEVQIETDKKE